MNWGAEKGMGLNAINRHHCVIHQDVMNADDFT